MTALQIEYDGIVYQIKNKRGQYWQGPGAVPQWAWNSVNGWMTDSPRLARCELKVLRDWADVLCIRF